MSIYDVIGRDRELTELSASTTMTALDVDVDGSNPTSPIRRENKSEILESILSLGEQLRVYGSDFSDLRSRLSQVEMSLSSSKQILSHHFVDDESCSRHVAAIFQDSDEQEKDGDLRQEDQYGTNTSDHSVA